MASWNDVRRLALALPGTHEESSSSGNPAWIVNNKFFVWDRPLRRADVEALGDRGPSGPIFGVRTTDLEMKAVLLASDPSIYFTTPHFDGYPAVLVQLEKIRAKDLRDLIVESWLSRAPKRVVTAFLQERKNRKK